MIEQSKRCPSVAVAHQLIDRLSLEPELAEALLREARPDAGRSWHGGVTGTQMAALEETGRCGAAPDRETLGESVDYRISPLDRAAAPVGVDNRRC